MPRSTPQLTGAQTSGEQQGERETPADEDGNGEIQASEILDAVQEVRELVGGFDRRLTDLEEEFDRRFTDLEATVDSLSKGQQQIRQDMAAISPLRKEVAGLETRTLALSRLVLDLLTVRHWTLEPPVRGAACRYQRQ